MRQTREQQRRHLQRWLGRAHRRIARGQQRGDAEMIESGVRSWNAAIANALATKQPIDYRSVFRIGR